MVGESQLTPVTISAIIPDNAMSRVSEDEANIPGKGRMISRLEYAIYDHLGTCVQSSANPSNSEVTADPDDHGHYTLKAELLKQHTYTFYIWASAAESPYTFNPLTKQVTVDYSKVTANDEKMDAFFGKKVFTIANEQTATDQYMVVLNRPFAQLNIMTNDSKLVKGLNDKVSISSISVAVNQAPGKYSLLNLDNFVAEQAADRVVFTAEFPNGWDDLVHAGSGDVADYYYLATCYLLTGSNPDESLTGKVGAAKETTDLAITINYSDNTSITLNKTGVPIRRSWRTNIWGSLETSEVNVNCRIDFNFDGSYGDGPGDNNNSSGPDDGDHKGDDNSNNDDIP